MLTIGELAEYAGVSVRTVRHYHQIGVLPEPARDELGHRRYDAESLILLRRICTLAEAGVPLRSTGEVLDAAPDDRDRLLADIDRDLQRRLSDLRRTRRRLAHLRTGVDAELPGELPRLLARLREIGLSEDQLRLDAESWTLCHLLYPDLTGRWLDQQLTLLDDAEYSRLYVEVLDAMHWPSDDPRLAELAERNVRWTRAHLDDYRTYVSEWNADPRAARLIETYTRLRYDSPTYRRFQALVGERLAALEPRG